MKKIILAMLCLIISVVSLCDSFRGSMLLVDNSKYTYFTVNPMLIEYNLNMNKNFYVGGGVNIVQIKSSFLGETTLYNYMIKGGITAKFTDKKSPVVTGVNGGFGFLIQERPVFNFSTLSTSKELTFTPMIELAGTLSFKIDKNISVGPFAGMHIYLSNNTTVVPQLGINLNIN